MKRIGERIKKKRELMHLHLNELAEKVGISPSALSQIEKAKSFPSIFTLKSIAVNLHTSVGELIGENESLAKNPVIQRKNMKLVDKNDDGTLVYLLSHHDINKQMDTYLVRFSKASGIGSLFSTDSGQIFCHILSGEVKFNLENNTYILKSGDSLYFSAKATYDAVNSSESISEMLWVQSPPAF